MFNIKSIAKRLIYPNKYSSDAYISYIRKRGGVIGNGVIFYSPTSTNIDTTGNSAHFIRIGDNVQITSGVIILGHDYSYSVLGNVYQDLPRVQRNTVVGNNVFIGMNTIILMGAHIGDNVIIGAGSVVSGKVESNSVYAGNPARKIRSLEEHYLKCKEEFIQSAAVYAEGIKTDNKPVDIKDMIIYQALFLDESQLSEYVMQSNFNGLSLESKQHIKMHYPKFASIDQLMEND